MSLYDKFLRKCFKRTYDTRGLRRAEKEWVDKMKAVPYEDRERAAFDMQSDIVGWQDWLREIDDERLVKTAAKMDVFLDNIDPPFSESERRRSHYEIGTFGNSYLNYEVRKTFRQMVRDRGAAYRKEKRETFELWVKIVTAAVGLIGPATGFLAVLTK